VFGNLNLRHAQNFLNVANTKFAPLQQMQDPPAGVVAQTLIDLNQVHT